MAIRAKPQTHIYARADPTLWLNMLMPRAGHASVPFPFDKPGLQYSYLARYGIYQAARQLGLDGQEVLFPAYFHGVELDALLAAGVRPRFFPVRAGMRVNPEDVVACLSPQTQAVYIIHYAGFPGPAAELKAICHSRNIYLIEDCALALLSSMGDRPLGSFGDVAIFCLYKTLPVPNGGAIRLGSSHQPQLGNGKVGSTMSTTRLAAHSLVHNLELRGGMAGRALRRTTRSVGRGISRVIDMEYVEIGTQHFDQTHVELGMSSLSHRMLKSLNYPDIVQRRRRNYAHLLDNLGDMVPSILGELPEGVCPLFYPIQVSNKMRAIYELHEYGVQAVNFWGIHHRTLPAGAFPVVDELRHTVLELPCHQDLTPAAIDRLTIAVRETLRTL